MPGVSGCKDVARNDTSPTVIARSEATWQSVLLAVAQNRKAILWANTESVTNLPKQQPTCPVSLRRRGLPHQCAHWFAMTCRNLPGVCGCKNVVHNDMLKTGTRLRMHGRGARWHLPHCHCEERSDGAIRSPAVGQNEKEIPSANTHLLRISPGTTFLQPQTPGRFLHVIARSEATGQSVLLAVAQNRKAILWANTRSITKLP